MTSEVYSYKFQPRYTKLIKPFKILHSGRAEAVTSLIQNGANYTVVDKNGHTPLHIAAEKGM